MRLKHAGLAVCLLLFMCFSFAKVGLSAGLATGFTGGNALPGSTARLTGRLTNANGQTSPINISTQVSPAGNFSLNAPVNNGADSITGTFTYQVKVGSDTQTNTLQFEWDRITSSVRFFGSITPYGSVALTTSGGAGTGAPVVADASGNFDTNDIVSSDFISGSTNVSLSVTNTEYTCSPCVYTPAVVNTLSYFVGLQTTGGSATTASANGGNSGNLSGALAGLAGIGLSALLGGGLSSGSDSAAIKDAVIDPLRAMTEEISSTMADQSAAKAQSADADATTDAARVVEINQAEIINEVRPTKAECDVTSLHTASAPEQIVSSDLQGTAASQQIGGNATGEAGTTGAIGAPQRTRFMAEQLQQFCNAGDMGGLLDDYCDQTSILLNPSALFGAQGTLDADFTESAGTNFSQIRQLTDTMIEPLRLPTAAQLERSSSERARFGSEGMWLINHKQALSDTMSRIIASNVGTSNANETEMRALLQEVGLSQDEQDRYFTADGKISEDAQLEILTHYYFLNPKFLTNIQENEAALVRIQARMQAVDLLLNTKIQEMSALKNRELSLFNAIDIRNESGNRNRALLTVSDN